MEQSSSAQATIEQATIAPSSPRGYRRFDRGQRIEHGILIASFTLLTLTGLPQKYPDSWWGGPMIQLMGGIETTRFIHHTAAIILVLQSVYHMIALGYRIWVLRHPLTMLPGWNDARDAVETLSYNIGRKATPPRMGRYTFGEKIEYWAVIWGTVIMILTGFMLWNPIIVTRFLPGQVVPAAKAAHGGEALLAVLSIVTWHVYNVHIKHFNRSMFTGYLAPHIMEEEHQLELSPQTAQIAPATSEQGRSRRRAIYLPIAAVLLTTLFIGVYFFFTYEQTAITTVPRQPVEIYVPVQSTPSP